MKRGASGFFYTQSIGRKDLRRKNDVPSFFFSDLILVVFAEERKKHDIFSSFFLEGYIQMLVEVYNTNDANIEMLFLCVFYLKKRKKFDDYYYSLFFRSFIYILNFNTWHWNLFFFNELFDYFFTRFSSCLNSIDIDSVGVTDEMTVLFFILKYLIIMSILL